MWWAAQNKLKKFADTLDGLKFSQSAKIITGVFISALRAYYKAVISGTIKQYHVKSGFSKSKMRKITANKNSMNARIYVTGRW